MQNSVTLKTIPVGVPFSLTMCGPENFVKIDHNTYMDTKYPYKYTTINNGWEIVWTSGMNGMKEVKYEDLKFGDEFQHSPWYPGDAAIKLPGGYKRIECGGMYYGFKKDIVYINPQPQGAVLKTTLDKLKVGDKFKSPYAGAVMTVVNIRDLNKPELNNSVFYISEDFIVCCATPEFLGPVEVVELSNYKQLNLNQLAFGDEYTIDPFDLSKNRKHVQLVGDGVGYCYVNKPHEIHKQVGNYKVWVKK